MKNTALPRNIFEQLGLADLPEQEKMDLLTTMTELILKRTMVRVGERLDALNLSEPERKKIMEVVSDEERFVTIQQYVPEMPDIMQEEIVRLREEMAAVK
ncbi:MAG: hypothetical protein HYV32_00300 [Candidatus Kerfeldbacteria bacterium]|nr:hypothetical protein [Candidatus Kerfeldbacteria bacterium]